MNSVGSLHISARHAGGALAGLDVRLERPPVTRLFVGQAPAAVESLVPSLYTLCARAQGAACRAALAGAAGEDCPPPAAAPLWAEALHEHLWRLLLDWPAALGLPPARDAFVAWRRARNDGQAGGQPGGGQFGGPLVAATFEILEHTLLGGPVREWLEGERKAGLGNAGEERRASEGALAAACRERLGPDSPAAHALPALTPADWLPYWRGETAAEPVPARPPSVAAAWRARLRQAAEAAVALADGVPYPTAAAGQGGWGIGQALTARGVLTHGVRLEGGRVAAYRVWAPTDCHFADETGLAALLGPGPWPDEAAARRTLERAVLALDPCLPHTLKVEYA